MLALLEDIWRENIRKFDLQPLFCARHLHWHEGGKSIAGETRPLARRPQKRRMPWAAYLWPGLPHLWNEGSWAGLALAVGFTVLLNTLILATFVWTEWLPERVKLACGLTTGVIWLAALWETRGELRRQAARQASDQLRPSERDEAAPLSGSITDERAEPADGVQPNETTGVGQLDELFVTAQHQYLAGNWVDAERTLCRLLRIDRDDIEGKLLLAMVWRMSDRTAKANRTLNRLARRQDAAAWQFEIQVELDRMALQARETRQTEEILTLTSHDDSSPVDSSPGDPDEPNEEHAATNRTPDTPMNRAA